ncbi:hypothetical protein [Actinomadura parmotrematis]|uniref:WD40 repeat domain-containing protein n=1 Tax=Actinomadura parmotrematis TaxID=2864039 RepID=A0ABS7G2L7_9ACTN|nr:hypothetical protein [Actinomadura parmotrematis]MBW8486965.1 hypothetical protein [Actinomadura parmotrematis]
MHDDLDGALRTALRTAAHDAPAPAPDLLEGVERGVRRRRRRRVTAAATAAVLVLGGTAGLAGVRDGAAPREKAPAAATGQGTFTDTPLGAPITIAKRWPAAVRTVPDRLPGGRELRPVRLLDGHVLIAATESAPGLPYRLWAYDLRTGKARVITDVPMTPETLFYAGGFILAGDQLVWRAGLPGAVEFWKAPLAGGPARRFAVLPKQMSAIENLVADGDAVVWASPQGIVRLPLAGGVPKVFAGTKGYGIVAWPWVGTPGTTKGGVGEVLAGTVRNLVTGEVRRASPPSFKGTWVCSLSWCVGEAAAGVTYRTATDKMITAVQARGEKDARALPPSESGPVDQIIADRFLPYRPARRAGGDLLYDLRTGNLLDLGTGGERTGIGVHDPARTQLFEKTRPGYLMVDLSKIT